MKPRLLIGIGLVTLTLSGATPSLAQSNQPTSPPASPAAPAQPGGPRGVGVPGGPRAFVRQQLEAVAKVLGITPQELMQSVRDGKTIGDLARENNVPLQQVVDVLVAPIKERLDAGVKAGELTQDQANRILAGRRAEVELMLSGQRFGFGPFGPGRGPR